MCNILPFCVGGKIMNYDLDMNMVSFGEMPPQAFMLGLLSAFDNRFQACGDKFFKEITWKQFFAIICINICKEHPTINELSEVMGSSHQNVKQILLKLESKEFVAMIPDEIIREALVSALSKKKDASQKEKDMAEMISHSYDISDEKYIVSIVQNIEGSL